LAEIQFNFALTHSQSFWRILRWSGPPPLWAANGR